MTYKSFVGPLQGFRRHLKISKPRPLKKLRSVKLMTNLAHLKFGFEGKPKYQCFVAESRISNANPQLATRKRPWRVGVCTPLVGVEWRPGRAIRVRHRCGGAGVDRSPLPASRLRKRRSLALAAHCSLRSVSWLELTGACARNSHVPVRPLSAGRRPRMQQEAANCPLMSLLLCEVMQAPVAPVGATDQLSALLAQLDKKMAPTLSVDADNYMLRPRSSSFTAPGAAPGGGNPVGARSPLGRIGPLDLDELSLRRRPRGPPPEAVAAAPDCALALSSHPLRCDCRPRCCCQCVSFPECQACFHAVCAASAAASNAPCPRTAAAAQHNLPLFVTRQIVSSNFFIFNLIKIKLFTSFPRSCGNWQKSARLAVWVGQGLVAREGILMR